jgi:glyoxylase-like metal-dependent hydrolase (beta-lactamase superfamily II)
MVGPPPPSWVVDPSAVSAFEVRPGLRSLRLPLPWPEISHVMAYLLERDDDRITLVDCGTAGHPSCWDALVAGLSLTAHGISEIGDLVLTHAHSDHLGLAKRIVDESGCTLWMHPAHEAFTDGALDPERIEAARRRRALEEGVPPDVIDQYVSVEEERDGALSPLPPFRELRAGVHVPSSLGSWEVVETPGHTPSHVALYLPSQRILIAGDLISRVFYPWYDYGYSNDPVGEHLASLAAVSQLDVAVALPGHGRPIEDVADVLAMHQQEIVRRLGAVEQAVAEGPAPAYVLTRRVFGAPGSMYQAVGAFMETIAYLRHLRLEELVVRERGPDGQFRYFPGGPASE